jgi:hypothetical protein
MKLVIENARDVRRSADIFAHYICGVVAANVHDNDEENLWYVVEDDSPALICPGRANVDIPPDKPYAFFPSDAVPGVWDISAGNANRLSAKHNLNANIRGFRCYTSFLPDDAFVVFVDDPEKAAEAFTIKTMPGNLCSLRSGANYSRCYSKQDGTEKPHPANCKLSQYAVAADQQARQCQPVDACCADCGEAAEVTAWWRMQRTQLSASHVCHQHMYTAEPGPPLVKSAAKRC